MIVDLAIAGVRIALEFDPSVPAPPERFGPFLGGVGPPAWRIRLAPGEAQEAQAPGRAVVEREGRWVVAGAEQAGWLDPIRRTGRAVADPALMALDALLRAAVAAEALRRGGLLVHGAAVAVDGAAYLCPARSGSGKSTLAALAGHPLSDEVSVLLPAAGGFEVHATPWWKSRGGSAPLAAICRLSWEGEGLAPAPGSALRLLAANLVLPLDGADARERALAAAAAVARGVPHARLAFQRHSDVDHLLRHPSAPLRGVGGAGRP